MVKIALWILATIAWIALWLITLHLHRRFVWHQVAILVFGAIGLIVHVAMTVSAIRAERKGEVV